MKMDYSNMPVQMVLHRLEHISKKHSIHYMKEMGINPGQAGMLFELERRGPLSQRDLAKVMGITPPSVTVALAKLEKSGHVQKETDSSDQRISRIKITEVGVECVVKMKQIKERLDAIMFDGISMEEKLLLRRILLQMTDNLLSNEEFKELEFKPGCDKMEMKEDIIR